MLFKTIVKSLVLASTLLTVATVALADVAPLPPKTKPLPPKAQAKSKILVVYFSRAGEQYSVGVVKKGNTAFVAEEIAKQTGADLFEIKPQTDNYPKKYDPLTDYAKKEQRKKERPLYAGKVPNLKEYDTIFVGAPVWWGDWPMIMYTFFEKNNLAGKRLAPFCTHEGSGLSGFDLKLKKACPKAVVLKGLALTGKTAQTDRDETAKAVSKWLDDLKIKKVAPKIAQYDSNTETIAMIQKTVATDELDPEKEKFDKENVFGQGELNTAYAKYFIGNSYLNPMLPKETPLSVVNVTFEPGCRNNWHVHKATKGGGQILICTAGEGWYQAEGEAAIELKPGVAVYIPANVKHWHGAKKDKWFSHIAIAVPGENESNEWLEPVDDATYDAL